MDRGVYYSIYYFKFFRYFCMLSVTSLTLHGQVQIKHVHTILCYLIDTTRSPSSSSVLSGMLQLITESVFLLSSITQILFTMLRLSNFYVMVNLLNFFCSRKFFVVKSVIQHTMRFL